MADVHPEPWALSPTNDETEQWICAPGRKLFETDLPPDTLAWHPCRSPVCIRFLQYIIDDADYRMRLLGIDTPVYIEGMSFMLGHSHYPNHYGYVPDPGRIEVVLYRCCARGHRRHIPGTTQIDVACHVTIAESRWNTAMVPLIPAGYSSHRRTRFNELLTRPEKVYKAFMECYGVDALARLAIASKSPRLRP